MDSQTLLIQSERMKIASAQIKCTVGEIQQNLDEHYRAVEDAIEEGVELIVFPEYSNVQLRWNTVEYGIWRPKRVLECQRRINGPFKFQ